MAPRELGEDVPHILIMGRQDPHAKEGKSVKPNRPKLKKQREEIHGGNCLLTSQSLTNEGGEWLYNYTNGKGFDQH